MSTRQEAISLARHNIALSPLYLDTETTGVGRNDEIVEISIIDDTGDEVFSSLVRPTRQIPADAVRIHGITNLLASSAPTWPVLWPRIQAVLSGRVVGIYNADFDMRLIQQTHMIYRMPWSYNAGFSSFCIMKLYAQFYGEWNPARGGFRWHSLEQAAAHCKIPVHNAHRASDDCQLARQVLQFIATQS